MRSVTFQKIYKYENREIIWTNPKHNNNYNLCMINEQVVNQSI